MLAHAHRLPRWDVRILVVEDEDAIAEPLAEGLAARGLRGRACRHRAGGARRRRARPRPARPAPPRHRRPRGLPAAARALARADHRRHRARRGGRPGRRARARGRRLRRQAVRPARAGRPHPRRHAPARSRAPEDGAVRVDGLEVDRARAARRSTAESSQLTPQEFDLLALLASRAGRRVSRERIFEEVWGTSWYGSSKTIDVHVAALRRKLGDPGWIETVRGVGFRLRA